MISGEFDRNRCCLCHGAIRKRRPSDKYGWRGESPFPFDGEGFDALPGEDESAPVCGNCATLDRRTEAARDRSALAVRHHSWRRLGFSGEDLTRLVAEEVSPEEAEKLLAIGVPCTADAILRWAAISASQVLVAADRGFTSAADFESFGRSTITGEQVRELRDLGCASAAEVLASFGIMQGGLDGPLAVTWARLGIPAGIVGQWIAGGIPPREAGKWHQAGVAPETAAQRRRSGLMPPPG